VKITSIETRTLEHALKPERVIQSHAGRHDRSRYLLVTLQDSEGYIGYGEAATTSLWSGETAETAERMVLDVFAPLIRDATFGHPSEVQAAVDRGAYWAPFARSAVDTAAWDLWAKRQNKRVADLIADRPPLTSIRTRASVGAYGVEKTVAIATALWRDGVRVIKFKTSANVAEDVARLRAVRDELGDEPLFTIDYNGALGHNADAAVHSIEALSAYDLALAEQPTHRDRISLLAAVKKRVSVPILADEAVFTPDHLREAIDLDAFDLLSIYPGKNGGFTHALAMAGMAAQAGKRCVIGSNLESDVGQAAMATLAAALKVFPAEEYAHDLGSNLFYQRSSVTKPLRLADGRIEVPTGSGFGIEPLP
jgi:L-alanine-DL-glutamate epimerase-like enolase superfamily enzyme